jgi:hypothetical protein
MSLNPVLKLDWCSYAAAKYAVEHWHYSHTMPVGKLAKLGVWEDQAFIGCLIFGLGGGGACNGRQYGLARNFEMAELQRIALRAHASPVSRMIAIACRLVAQYCPGLRLLISYADPTQHHHGGVYQAANWIYTGQSASDWKAVWANGKQAHSRIARGHVQFGVRKTVDISQAVKVPVLGKHRYLYPLDAAMRAQIQPLAQPYPKRATSIAVDAPTVQAGEEGATPIVALARR